MIVKASALPQNQMETKCTNVLHLINGEHFAGAERVQDLLACTLPQLGFQADFVCLKLGKFREVRTSQSRLFDVNMRNAYDLFVINRIVKIAKDHDYKLIHAHTPRTLMIGSFVARRLKLPLIYHVHSPVGRDSTRKLRNKINTWVETQCLRQVAAMICVSGSLKNYMSDLGHDDGKLHLVRNGVPCCFDLPERHRPNDAWTLGTMALFRPRKGIETLLEALADLRSRQVNVQLRAVGGFETKEYESEVKQLAKQLQIEDIVNWTGFQTDINAQLQEMDLFVLPSLFGEGLPMVVLESMAQKVPVVASNVEGIPEAVRDGVDGLIFEPGSAKDLADKVQSLLGDCIRWIEMGENALERQRNALSDISMATGVAAVYDHVTRQCGQSPAT